MLIIDSLLMSKFFLSLGEVRRTLSLFRVAQAQAATALTARCGAQLGTVVGLIRAKHGKPSMQEFPHGPHVRLPPLFASSQ